MNGQALPVELKTPQETLKELCSAVLRAATPLIASAPGGGEGRAAARRLVLLCAAASFAVYVAGRSDMPAHDAAHVMGGCAKTFTGLLTVGDPGEMSPATLERELVEAVKVLMGRNSGRISRTALPQAPWESGAAEDAASDLFNRMCRASQEPADMCMHAAQHSCPQGVPGQQTLEQIPAHTCSTPSITECARELAFVHEHERHTYRQTYVCTTARQRFCSPDCRNVLWLTHD